MRRTHGRGSIPSHAADTNIITLSYQVHSARHQCNVVIPNLSHFSINNKYKVSEAHISRILVIPLWQSYTCHNGQRQSEFLCINPLMSLMQQEVEFTDIGSNEEEMKEQDMVFDKVENTVDTEKCNIDMSSLLGFQ